MDFVFLALVATERFVAYCERKMVWNATTARMMTQLVAKMRRNFFNKLTHKSYTHTVTQSWSHWVIMTPELCNIYNIAKKNLTPWNIVWNTNFDNVLSTLSKQLKLSSSEENSELVNIESYAINSITFMVTSGQNIENTRSRNLVLFFKTNNTMYHGYHGVFRNGKRE